MTISRMALGVCLAQAAALATADAQTMRQPATPVAYDYGYYAPGDNAPSPSDKPTPAAPMQPMAPEAGPVPAAPAAGAPCQACQSCNNGCNQCCQDRPCCTWDVEDYCCPTPCDAWKLFDCCCLKCNGFEIGGWIDAGVMGNGDDPASHWNGPVVMTDRDDFQMNQAYLFLKKEIDYKKNCGWAWGGRIDTVYGTDARYIEALGFETHQDGSNKWNGERFYHLAMPQLYVEAAYDDLSIKAGRWYCPVGNESFMAPENFFYSHTYMIVYSEPFTMTGVLFTKPLDDEWKIFAGFDRGWDKWEDDNDKLSFIGGIYWTGKVDSIVFTILTGDEIAPVTGVDANRTLLSTVYTHNFNKYFKLVLQNDDGWQTGGANGGNDIASWYGVAGWLQYQFSCDWSVGFRFEWFQDTDGTRVAALGDSQTQPVNSNPAGSGGFAGNFYDYSIGLNYKPVCNPNLVVRPEIRWDNYSGTGHPFDDGTKNNQFLIGIDAIVKF